MGIIGIRKAEAGSSGHAHLPPASWGRRTALLLLSLCLTSCSLSLTSCSEVLSKDVAAPKGQPASPDLNPETKPKEESKPKAASYAAALRQGDFVAAKKAFLEATPAERAHPEVLYAEAQVALELGDVESALKNAALLEEGAPLFRAEAQDLRLRAARMSQDVTLLEHFLGESKTRTSDAALGDRLILAEAYQHGASIREALELTDGCLAVLAKRKKPGKQEQRLEAQTRLLRAKLFVNLDQDENAAREYRWLANQGVTEPEALDADARAEQLDPKRPLTAAQRFDRAKAFSEQGLLERTDQELRQLKKAPGTRPTEAETDAVLAWAVYASRSDYKRAAELFAKAAKAGGEDRRKHLYYAAKSLARAHEDEAAIKGYQALAALGGTYGEHASYQAPHLLFMSGKLAQALAGYEDYLKRFRSGAHRDHVHYDLALVRLISGNFKKAEEDISLLIKQETSARSRARLEELRGVALLGQDKKEEASAVFRQVIADRPLSLAALFSEARLVSMGETPPPRLLPAESTGPTLAPLQLSLPEKVWRLSRVGLDDEAEAALKSEEAALKRKYGERAPEALCRLYGQLESAVRRYQIAQTASRWSTLKSEVRPKDQWQWECIYPTPYSEFAVAESAKRDIPPSFLYGIMRQESAFRRSVVSPANAVGLMQIIPPTATRIAEEIGEEYVPDNMNIPATNIRFGAYYLRRLLNMLGNQKALVAASYNAGPAAVSRWLKEGDKLPLDLFVARIPYSETRNYVYRVMGNYARYAHLSATDAPVTIDLAIPEGIRATDDAY